MAAVTPSRPARRPVDAERVPGTEPTPGSGRAGRSLRAVGWVATPVLGVLLAVLATTLDHASAQQPVDTWHALEPWTPTVLPARVGYAVQPWAGRLAAATLLTLGLCLALLAVVVLRRVPARRRAVRVVALWLAVVVAAVLVVGGAELGSLLRTVERSGGGAGPTVRLFVLPALGGAARWGLLWGWAPAVVTALLRPGRGAGREEDGRRGRPRRALALVGVLVLATAGSAAWLVRAAYEAAVSTETQVVRPPVVEPVPDPPAASAPVAAPTPAGACDPADLAVTVVGQDAALGFRVLTLAVTSTAPAPCVVQGRPDLAFADADGDAVRPAVVPGTRAAETGDPPDPAPLTLEPGAAAWADVTWRAQAPAGSRTVATVHAAPWAGLERTALAAALDVVDGGAVAVSPWYAPPVG